MATFKTPTLDAAGRVRDKHLPTRLEAAELSAAYAPRQAAPTTAPAPGIYDPRLTVYNLKPAQVRRARAALAKARAGTGFCRVATLGDSTVAGQGATSATAWPLQLKDMLDAAGFPSAGTGLVPAAAGLNDARFVFGAGWGGAVGSMKANSTTTNPATFTSDSTGSIARVYYSNATGQSTTFTVSVDGGAGVTVTNSGASVMGVYEVAGLADTTHTITITRATGAVYIFGAEVRSHATRGVLLYNAGYAGIKVATLADQTWYQLTPISARVANWNSDLIFVMCETNDANAAATPAEVYKTQMQTAITAARANGASVILMTAIPSSGVDFTLYTKALYELADSNDLPLIDLQDRWQTYAASNASGLMADALHPTAAGYADIARALFITLGL